MTLPNWLCSFPPHSWPFSFPLCDCISVSSTTISVFPLTFTWLHDLSSYFSSSYRQISWRTRFRGWQFVGLLCVIPHIVPGGVVKNPPAKEEMCGFDLWAGGSPGEENGNPLQYSCLEISLTEEPGRLQSMRLQKSWTWKKNWKKPNQNKTFLQLKKTTTTKYN